ncbi:hypothetical protein TrRE_jg8333 [Triparma retinervis]|uniref:WW domain-containing protein n=1 Tax=Triparma retinervis TaxID=2557542 RepID=A0A9W7DNF9_9STRA|nr:hypothetical protein TrRE_jg8333 [Triparma retinervis]
MLRAVICFCLWVRLSFAANYVTSHWKLTDCVSECSNSRCPSGHRIYSGEWFQLSATDSYGTSYEWCWPMDEKCQCYACNVGHFDSATDCTQCPGGTIQPALGQTSCSPCSSGHVSNTDRTVCDQCGAGKYAALTTCESCVPGSYSSPGAAVCSPCQPGSFSGSSASSCTSCTAGKYTLDVTVEECTPCSAGRYASEDGAGSCTPCLAGTFSAEGASSCSNCEAGKYTLGGSGDCSICPAGTYSDDGSAACTPCGAGTFSEEAASSCYSCGVGKYRLASPDGCQDCAAGRYVDSEGSSVCSLCSAGTSSGEGAVSCVDCQVGRYSTGAQATPCNNCNPGKYQGVKGSSTCDECGRGKFSPSAAPSCSDCEEGKWSVRGESVCYEMAVGFDTCPEHPTSDHPVDNECNYLFEGSWEEVDEGEGSSFGGSCASLALCEHVSSDLEDDYYLMCAECAEGKVALGYNEETRGDCNVTRSFPLACVEPETLSSCPDGESVNDDCEYYYEGDWESKDGGQSSPFINDACSNYSPCHVEYGVGTRQYHLSCTECAEGLLAFYDSAGDASDDVPQSCHGDKVSECYSAQLYATCPDQIGLNGDSNTYLNNLASCTYLGKTGYGGSVKGNQPAPFITSCSQYELVSRSRQEITSYGFAYDYTIACKQCNSGLEAGDFITSNGCPDEVKDAVNNAAKNNLEIFMGVVALLMCFLGLAVYKCYSIQKEKLMYDENGERVRERRMWSFDEEDVIASGISSGGSMRREGGSSGYSAHTEMRRLTTDYSTNDLGDEDDHDDDDEYDDGDWTVRTATTWTDRRKQNSTRRGELYPEFTRDDNSSAFGYASNPMQASGEGDDLDIEGKIPSMPRPPPPPPQGWSRAVDAKGREYFYNEVGRTVWHVSECD